MKKCTELRVFALEKNNTIRFDLHMEEDHNVLSLNECREYNYFNFRHPRLLGFLKM